MLLGGGAEKGRANKANMRDGFKRLSKLSQINSWKKYNYLDKKKYAEFWDIFKVIIFGVSLPDT